MLDSGYEWVGEWAVEVGDGGGDREGQSLTGLLETPGEWLTPLVSGVGG